MKLSEAIRAGQNRPQCTHSYICKDEDGTISTCALGGAYEAIYGKLPRAIIGAPVHEACKVPVDVSVLPAETWRGFCANKIDLGRAITLLNDYDGWTKAQIADWVESLGY